jgi:CopA family copper-resistance protein
MHPEIHSATAGRCPKCGMFLEKKTVKIIKQSMPLKKGDGTRTDSKTNNPSILKPAKASEEKARDTIFENIVPVKQEEKENGYTIETPLVNYKSKTVRYDLYVTDTLVNFSSKTKHALAINGSIPAPTLTFTESDTAEIYVHNMLDVGTSLHWHGVFLPNKFDGVPYLTQMPIAPHSTHLYRFPVIQNGTYWYHSHSDLQEQSGMYGAIILLKKNEQDIPAIPIVLSDWTDMKPKEVHRSLHNATDWFAIKKGSTQSYGEAITSGHFGTKVCNEWKRMNAMDVSDVFYEKFLINGKSEIEIPGTTPPSLGEESEVRQFKAGDKVKLRIVNGSSSTYFWLTYGGSRLTVVGNDGNDVQPVEVDRLLIAVAETYDVIVTIPENMSYEFLATAEDRTKSASLWLGSGMKMTAAHLPKLKYFEGMKMMNSMMKMNGDMKSMGMQMSNQTMDMNEVMYAEMPGHSETGESIKNEMKMDTILHYTGDTGEGPITLNYDMLRATEKTTLPTGPLKELKFELTGNMNRYVWTLDNKTVSEAEKILIKKGENIRIVLYNNTMMRHPMHLHGHDFRVLNRQGDYAPLKNVLDIMPMETDTIEFAATESGDWFFHCHILYHMMSGMGRVFSYVDSPPNPEIPDPKYAQRKLFADDRMFHFMTKTGIESNGSDGEAMIANTRWKLETMWHLGYNIEHGESETMLGHYLGKMQWWYPYIGFDFHYKMEGMLQDNFLGQKGNPKNIFGSEEKNWFGQVSNKNNRKAFVVGIAYTLPMLLIADARIDTDGKLRFQLSREDIPVSSRLRFGLMINTDKEYMVGFRYIVTKYVSLSTHYDNDMGLGAGLTFTY